jgi:hypothetical protein
MNSNKTRSKLLWPITALGLLALPPLIHAAPYACDLTNNAGVVSFRLNENADNVRIISGGGAVTNDIGPGVKGVTITNLGVAPGTIKVMVTRSAPAGYTQTTVDLFQDGNGIYVNKFEQPRGITVNKNSATPSFGRIYIANGQDATTTAPASRNTLDGIYMINSDDTVALDTGVTPRTAGLPFDTANAVSPFRLSIGKDDGLLYISDDSDLRGGLWVCDLDVATNSIATNVFEQIGDQTQGATNHGSIYSAVIEGSLAGNNLRIFTMDEDLPPVKSAWRYDINSGPLPWTGPTNFLHNPDFNNPAIKLVKGGVSNYLYVSENRSVGTDKPSISIFTENGVFITNSLAFTRSNFNTSAPDIFRNTTSIDISPDGNTLALLRGASFGTVLLVPITNGVLNVAGTNSFSLGTSGASENNRDIAYDAAGNLYVINTATEWFRIFSKGGATVAITGTDGTFVMGVPPAIVSIAATTANANEQGLASGAFTISRTGDTSVSLTVNYTIGGTATAGSDYTTLSGSVTFLPGATATNITVTVLQDAVAELTETVVLTISGSGAYGVSGGPATVSIFDNEPTEVSIGLATAESRLLEGYSESKIGLQLIRRGSNSPALTVNFGYSGTATRGADFNAPVSVTLGANAATLTTNMTSIDDELYEGNETATVSVISGTGYAIGSSSSTNVTVVEDDLPAGVILFADNFETDASANWITNANDFFFDSSATFAYDYSAKFVPPVPGGSSTKGLLFRLNEMTGAPINAVSASPILPGDLPDQYRMKFKMWINYNGRTPSGPLADGGAGSTLHLTSGVGTTPDHANLATFGGSDGIWFGVDGDGGSTFAVGDANAYIATDLQADASGVYAAGTDNNPRSTTHPYYSIWGDIAAPAAQVANYPSQAGKSQVGNLGVSWHTVYITKTTNVTWTIDGIPVAAISADATPLGTNVFIGYQDLFAGAAGTTNMSFALVENFRLETFISAPIVITDTKIVGGNVEVTFSGPAEVAPGSFKLESSGLVSGAYVQDNSANIVSLGSGIFKATAALTGTNQFYRIKL